jgi:simple sugar transport system permease protein
VLSRLSASKWFWPLAALVLLLLYNLFFTPGFFSIEVKDGHLFGSLIDILNRSAPVMLLAIGMTLVIATKGIDLSVGAVMAIAGAAAAWMITRPGNPVSGLTASLLGLQIGSDGTAQGVVGLFAVVAITLVFSVLLGAWNGLLVSVFDVQPMVATLILMVSGRGVAQLITDGQIVTFHHPGVEFIGNGFLFSLPFSVTLVVVVLAVTAIATRLTAMGLFIESVGDNQTASHYSGVNVRWVKMFVYMFCGLCAGVAGLIAVSNIKGADANHAGLNLELDAILAVVVGGTSMNGGRFYLVGSVLGALIIQTLTTTILTRGVPPEDTLVVKAIAVLIVCLLQSEQFRSKFVRRRSVRA